MLGYGIANEKDNFVGVSYTLIKEMAGKPWNRQGPPGKCFTDDEDMEVWNRLAGNVIELQRHPFTQAGSQLSGPFLSKLMVPALASERFLDLSSSGLFNTIGGYYAVFLTQKLALIVMGSYLPIFLCMRTWCSVRETHVRYLAIKLDCDSVGTAEQFYIKHARNKGDHLMVDDDLNVSGIINWQMARVVPASEVFGPSLVIANMGNIYNGVSSLTLHGHALARLLMAKGPTDLAGLMPKDEKHLFDLDIDFPWNGIPLLIRGIWAAFRVNKDTDWKI